MVPGLLRLRPDNAPQVFFARDASPLEEHTRLREAFPGGGEVRVALTGPGLFTTEGLAWAGELETRLAEVEGVRLAAGPLAVHRWSESAWPPSDLAAYRARLDRAAAGRMAGWVAPDGGTLSSLVLFEPGAGPATLAAVEHAVSGSPTGVEVHLTGLPVLQRALDEGVQSVAFRIVPLLVGVSTLLLLLVFRRLRRALAPLLLVGFVELVTFGAMGYAGAPINLVNSVLAPLLFVIGLASAVHVLMQFVRTHTGGQDPVEAAQRTFRDKAPPIVWSGATTFVAFGSLALSDLPVVSALGGWSALGIAVLTAAMFTLYPALLVWAAGARGAHTPPVLEAHASRWGRSLAEGAVRHRHSVTVATLALMGACTAGLPRLAVGDDLVMAFREGHPARASLDFLQDEKMGAFPLEVLVELGAPESPEGAGLREPARLQALAELSARLRDDPRIAAAFGPGDLVEEAIEAILVEGEVDENLRWMALATVQSVPESKALLRSILSDDSARARLVLLVPSQQPELVSDLVEDIRRAAHDELPQARVYVGGEYPLVLLGQRHLLHAMGLGFLGTLGGVALAFLAFLRSPGQMALMLIPNVLPVAVVVGALAWLGVRADSAAVMTASIVLGLAVDDTFHTLGYHRHFRQRLPRDEAIVERLALAAPANILTSIILALGFLACAGSALVPVSRFGIMMIAAVGFALLGDLVVVPALLPLGRRR